MKIISRIFESKGRFKLKLESDRGDASIISALFALPLLYFVIVSTIDVGMFFNNRAMVTDMAREGARVISVMGGAGNQSHKTALEDSFARSMTTDEIQNCDVRNVNYDAEKHGDYQGATTYNASNAVECFLAQSLINDVSTFRFHPTNVECGPEVTASIGDRAYCNIEYHYGGLTGSFFWALSLGSDEVEDGEGNTRRIPNGYMANHEIGVSSFADVAYNEEIRSLVPRG